MIDLDDILRIITKSAAAVPQDPGAQAMAAAANIAKPSGSPPMPKMIDQGAEAAKQDAELQKQQEKQQQRMDAMDEENAKLRAELEEAKTLAMKNDALRELAEKRVEHNNAIVKERVAANDDLMKQRQQAIKEQEGAVQQLAQIKQDALTEKFEASKQMAEESAQHQMELAQQKADSVVALADMQAKSYMKATEDARKLQDKYMADAHKQIEAERASRAGLSPALQNQVDNALNAVSVLSKKAAIFPVPGDIPVLVKAASGDMVDMVNLLDVDDPLSLNPSGSPGEYSVPEVTFGTGLDAPQSGLLPQEEAAKIIRAIDEAKNLRPANPDDIDDLRRVAEAEVAKWEKQNGVQLSYKEREARIKNLVNEYASNPEAVALHNKFGHSDESETANGLLAAVQSGNPTNPNDLQFTANSLLSAAQEIDNNLDNFAPSERERMRSLVQLYRNAAQEGTAQAQKTIAALKAKPNLTPEEQQILTMNKIYSEPRVNLSGIALHNPVFHLNNYARWAGLGDTWLGRNLNSATNAVNDWSERHLGVGTGSYESPFDEAKHQANRHPTGAGSMVSGFVLNAGLGAPTAVANDVSRMWRRSQIEEAGLSPDARNEVLTNTGVGDSYGSDVGSLALNIATAMPEARFITSGLRLPLNFARKAVAGGEAATRGLLSRGKFGKAVQNSIAARALASNAARNAAGKAAGTAAGKATGKLPSLGGSSLDTHVYDAPTLMLGNPGTTWALSNALYRTGNAFGRARNIVRGVESATKTGRIMKNGDRYLRRFSNNLGNYDPLLRTADMLHIPRGLADGIGVPTLFGLKQSVDNAREQTTGIGAGAYGVYLPGVVPVAYDENDQKHYAAMTYGKALFNGGPTKAGWQRLENEAISRYNNGTWMENGGQQLTPGAYTFPAYKISFPSNGLSGDGMYKTGSAPIVQNGSSYSKLPMMTEGENPYSRSLLGRVFQTIAPFVSQYTEGQVQLTPNVQVPQDDPRKTINGPAVAEAASYAPSLMGGGAMAPAAEDMYSSISNAYAAEANRPGMANF